MGIYNGPVGGVGVSGSGMDKLGALSLPTVPPPVCPGVLLLRGFSDILAVVVVKVKRMYYELRAYSRLSYAYERAREFEFVMAFNNYTMISGAKGLTSTSIRYD